MVITSSRYYSGAWLKVIRRSTNGQSIRLVFPRRFQPETCRIKNKSSIPTPACQIRVLLNNLRNNMHVSCLVSLSVCTPYICLSHYCENLCPSVWIHIHICVLTSSPTPPSVSIGSLSCVDQSVPLFSSLNGCIHNIYNAVVMCLLTNLSFI